MIGEKLGHRLDGFFSRTACLLFGKNIHPHLLTIAGLLINMGAALCMAIGYWVAGGCLILVAGLFDLFDGAVARAFDKATKFGSFLDSVIDRYSDTILLIGIIWHYGTHNEQGNVLLACIVLMGSVLIPYSRAKAEIYVDQCNIGLMERAERTILLAMGGIFNMMVIALWVLAILTHTTVLQRIYHTWKEMRQLEERTVNR
jgi:CDP-diacylglycerol--glycerol-3-phosphate 3-phosphatidyltransferase